LIVLINHQFLKINREN